MRHKSKNKPSAGKRCLRMARFYRSGVFLCDFCDFIAAAEKMNFA